MIKNSRYIPKTIKGLTRVVKILADIPFEELKGYKNLSAEQKEVIMFLIGDCNNYMEELTVSSLKK